MAAKPGSVGLDTPAGVPLAISFQAMQPTYRPSKLSRARKCGFRARSKTPGGRKVLAARRKIGRKRLGNSLA